MGISEIENRLREKRSYKLKSIELRLIQLLSEETESKNFKKVLDQLIEEFGIIILEDKQIIRKLENALRELNIDPKIFFENIVFKDEIFKKSFFGGLKLNHEKLGLFLYQNALFLKKEHGGIFTLSELLNTINEASSQKITADDIIKSIGFLERKGLIPGRRKISDNVEVVQFLPFELSSDHKLILEIATEKGWITIEELAKEISWPIERIKVSLSKLEELGIAKLDPSYSKGNRYYFPAFLSEQ
jgi:hypothetical protein